MRKILTTTILLVMVACCVGVAKADTLTYHGMTFDVSVSGTTVTLTVNGAGCDYTAGCAGIYIGDVTVKAFSQFSGITSSSVKQNNVLDSNYASAALGNLGGTGCGLQSNGFICFAASSGTLLTNGTLVFTATVTDPVLLDLLAGGYSVQAEFFNSSTLIRTGSDNTFVDQMSESTSVPEPASLSFLGIALGGLALRKFRRT